jgi:hypothetical protein
VAAALLSLLLDGHHRLPLLGEVIVQHGQGDVGQQRGEESGSGDALPCPRPLRTVRARRPRIRLKQVLKVFRQAQLLVFGRDRAWPGDDRRSG